MKRLYKLLLPLSVATITAHATTKTIKHTVKSGESLYTIAKKNHTTIDTLCQVNHIKRDKVLKVGQAIKIPVKGTKSVQKHVKKSTYTVKKGDTLIGLAKRYHTTVSAIREANGLSKKDMLKYGQKLTLPVVKKTPHSIHLAKKRVRDQEKKLARTLISQRHIAPKKEKKRQQAHRYSLSDIVFGSNHKKEHTLSAKSQKIIELAKKKLGKRYVWGAVGQRNTFDCSGLTSYVCKANGIHIPRRAIEQSKYGKYVSRSELKPGDLVFFDTSKRRRGYVNHVGIYIGNGKFIHASSAKKKVVITSLNKPFYSQRFKGGRRVASL